MSYARWGEESDIYLWRGHDGSRAYWVCHHVGEDHDHAVVLQSRFEAVAHLEEDRQHGLKIPEEAIARLRKEIAE